MQAYGDVYFRAWRAATGPYLEAIEQVGPWLVGWVGWLVVHRWMHAAPGVRRMGRAHAFHHTCMYTMKNSRQDCVQDLMQCAVTCASPALYASLRLFLQARPSRRNRTADRSARARGIPLLFDRPTLVHLNTHIHIHKHPKPNDTHTHKAQAFHANKRLREVDAMLLRLYNPILWRCVLHLSVYVCVPCVCVRFVLSHSCVCVASFVCSGVERSVRNPHPSKLNPIDSSLKVANPVVRAQATGLLVDAFPLQDPTMGAFRYYMYAHKQSNPHPHPLSTTTHQNLLE